VPRAYEELKRRLQEESARLRGEIEELGSGEQERPGYGNHMADDATAVFEQTWNLSLRESLEGTLRRVEEALSRFEDSTYGVCLECGQGIEWGRLKTIPHASLCVECARRRERQS
jgi:RNA polymerase-binding transcription factor DksA